MSAVRPTMCETCLAALTPVWEKEVSLAQLSTTKHIRMCCGWSTSHRDEKCSSILLDFSTRKFSKVQIENIKTRSILLCWMHAISPVLFTCVPPEDPTSTATTIVARIHIRLLKRCDRWGEMDIANLKGKQDACANKKKGWNAWVWRAAAARQRYC